MLKIVGRILPFLSEEEKALLRMGEKGQFLLFLLIVTNNKYYYSLVFAFTINIIIIISQLGHIPIPARGGLVSTAKRTTTTTSARRRRRSKERLTHLDAA